MKIKQLRQILTIASATRSEAGDRETAEALAQLAELLKAEDKNTVQELVSRVDKLRSAQLSS